jgi:hypothetical protein
MLPQSIAATLSDQLPSGSAHSGAHSSVARRRGVRLAYMDDEALGDALEIHWNVGVDRRSFDDAG